jgi:hypothetical protein
LFELREIGLVFGKTAEVAAKALLLVPETVQRTDQAYSYLQQDRDEVFHCYP